MPKVSINLCCYNSERFLEETLASVFAQTFKDYELVIVNDGSKDGTDALIRKHIASGRPIVYHPQENQGLGKSRNKALELSKGPLIAILDHDDVWEPRKLERQVRLFDRPEVGFAGSDAIFIDSAGKEIGRYSEGRPLRRGNILRDLFLYNFIPCAAAMMRKSSIEAAGGFFRPDFRISEEYEMFLRLAERFEFDYVDEPLVRIRVHPGSAGWDVDRERAEMRQAYSECLARNPDLATQLGARVLSVKRNGFWLKPEEAAELANGFSFSKAAFKAEGLYLLSMFGPETADRLLRCKREAARRLSK